MLLVLVVNTRKVSPTGSSLSKQLNSNDTRLKLAIVQNMCTMLNVKANDERERPAEKSERALKFGNKKTVAKASTHSSRRAFLDRKKLICTLHSHTAVSSLFVGIIRISLTLAFFKILCLFVLELAKVKVRERERVWKEKFKFQILLFKEANKVSSMRERVNGRSNSIERGSSVN